ncbi:MAG: hypothetical protein Q9M35_11370 [Rhodothermus sp.]|nr:hypothetical protein [Rhodothermus sp.]
MGVVKSIDDRIGRFARKRPIQFLMMWWIVVAIMYFILDLIILDINQENLLRHIINVMGKTSLLAVISLATIQYLSFVKKEMKKKKSKLKLIWFSLFAAIIGVTLFAYYFSVSNLWVTHLNGVGFLLIVFLLMLIFITIFSAIVSISLIIMENFSNKEEL